MLCSDKYKYLNLNGTFIVYAETEAKNDPQNVKNLTVQSIFLSSMVGNYNCKFGTFYHS